MKITDTTAKVRMLSIENAAALDPVDVFIVNYAPGKGRITIRCWDRAWTCAWFAMGGLSIEQFFIDADRDYILNNISTHGLRVDAKKRERDYVGRIVDAVKRALSSMENVASKPQEVSHGA